MLHHSSFIAPATRDDRYVQASKLQKPPGSPPIKINATQGNPNTRRVAAPEHVRESLPVVSYDGQGQPLRTPQKFHFSTQILLKFGLLVAGSKDNYENSIGCVSLRPPPSPSGTYLRPLQRRLQSPTGLSRHVQLLRACHTHANRAYHVATMQAKKNIILPTVITSSRHSAFGIRQSPFRNRELFNQTPGRTRE